VILQAFADAGQRMTDLDAERSSLPAVLPGVPGGVSG